MKYFIKYRSFSYFFLSYWYANRLKYQPDLTKKYYFIYDIGAITIGKRKK